MPRHALRAFTLIEVLVVVSIVVLLIAILLPVLGKGRHVARTMQCLSNMRQIESAHYAYVGDYDGRMIDVGLAHGGVHADEDSTWIKTLQDYWSHQQDSVLGSEVKARSPLDDSPHWGPLPQGDPIPGSPTDQRRRTSYGLNDYLTSAAPFASQRHTRFDQIRRPGQTVHVLLMAFRGEYAGSDHVHATGWFGTPEQAAGRAASQVQTNAVAGELGDPTAKGNWSFLDGHAQTLPFESLGSGPTANRFNPSSSN